MTLQEIKEHLLQLSAKDLVEIQKYIGKMSKSTIKLKLKRDKLLAELAKINSSLGVSTALRVPKTSPNSAAEDAPIGGKSRKKDQKRNMRRSSGTPGEKLADRIAAVLRTSSEPMRAGEIAEALLKKNPVEEDQIKGFKNAIANALNNNKMVFEKHDKGLYGLRSGIGDGSDGVAKTDGNISAEAPRTNDNPQTSNSGNPESE
jgi:hypothetical protein